MTSQDSNIAEILKIILSGCENLHLLDDINDREYHLGLYSKAIKGDILSKAESKDLNSFLFDILKKQPSLVIKIDERFLGIEFLCLLSNRMPNCLLFLSKDIITPEKARQIIKYNIPAIKFLIKFQKQLKNITPEEYVKRQMSRKDRVSFEKIPSEQITDQYLGFLCSLTIQDSLENAKVGTPPYYVNAEWPNNGCPLYLPEDILDEEFITELTSKGRLLFENIPEKFLTEEIVKRTLLNSFVPFGLIPKKFVTKELLLEVVKNKGDYISEIPDPLLDDELIHSALFESKLKKYENLDLIQEKISNDTWIKMVRTYPHSFNSIPKEVINREFLKQIIDVLPNDYLDRIPLHLVDDDLVIDFCTKNRINLSRIPTQVVTKILILKLTKIVPISSIYCKFHAFFDRELLLFLEKDIQIAYKGIYPRQFSSFYKANLSRCADYGITGSNLI